MALGKSGIYFTFGMNIHSDGKLTLQSKSSSDYIVIEKTNRGNPVEKEKKKMKKIGKVICMMLVLCLMLVSICPCASAEKKSTGLKKGQVLATAYAKKPEKNAILYPVNDVICLCIFKVEDIYESETYQKEVFVQYAPGSSWTYVSETNGYSLSQSVTVNRSQNVSFEMFKKMGLTASYTISKSQGMSGATSIKPNKKTKYKKCRPVIKSDFYVITFYRYFYYGNQCVARYKMTEKIPVNNTGFLCYEYKN